MTWPLLRKEMRDQRPFAWIGVVLIALDLLEATTRQIDRQPLGHHFSAIGDPSAGFQLLVAFAVGTGLLMREHDEGTLGFLDGLPVTRARLFLTKIGVALGALLIYPVGRLLLFAFQHVVSRDSLNRPLHPHLLLVALALTALITFVGLSAGLLLGFLRSLAWLAFGLCAVALAEGIKGWPWLSAFNPVELMKVRLVGSRWRVPMDGLGVQLCVGTACAAIALVLFVSAGRGRKLPLAKWLQRPLVSAIVGAALIAVALWAGALYLDESPAERSRRELSEMPGMYEFPEAPPGHAGTRHYTFSYPALRSRQLQPLLEGGDRTFERVEALLRFESTAAIDVDLSGSVRNTEGTAFLDRIRMNPGVVDPLVTLAHETTHVLALRLSGGERERELSKMVVFNEGLARWVQLQLSEPPGLPDLDRLQAAVVSRRSLVSPEMLTDFERLARTNDQDLKYPLGAVLIDTFIRRHGPEAPRRLLSTLARPDFPRHLHGLELWQAAFQLAGFDLALTLDDYAGRLETWEREFAHVIDRFPRPRGTLVHRGELVGIAVRLDGPLPEGWSTVVRFRPAEESPLSAYMTQSAIGDVAWQSRGEMTNDEVCFQPGLEAGGVTIFEAWNCLPLDSAADRP